MIQSFTLSGRGGGGMYQQLKLSRGIMAGAIFRLYLSSFRRRALNKIKDKISDFTLKIFCILCYSL